HDTSLSGVARHRSRRLRANSRTCPFRRAVGDGTLFVSRWTDLFTGSSGVRFFLPHADVRTTSKSCDSFKLVAVSSERPSSIPSERTDGVQPNCGRYRTIRMMRCVPAELDGGNAVVMIRTRRCVIASTREPQVLPL